jgi:hypothetical protein
MDTVEFQASDGSKAPILPFVLLLGDGTVLPAPSMNIVVGPKVAELEAKPNASRLSERIAGKAIVVDFEDERARLHIIWRVVLRNGSNYVRQELVLNARSSDVAVREVRLLDWHSPSARALGTARGSPVVDGILFAGLEDPLSSCAAAGERTLCWSERDLPLKAGQSVTHSSVIGITAESQLRRGFLRYVERERAHPYRTFLHYNSWYDLGYFSKYDEC